MSFRKKEVISMTSQGNKTSKGFGLLFEMGVTYKVIPSENKS